MEGEGESSPSRVSGGSLSKEVKRMHLEHQFPRVLFKTREAGWWSAGLKSLVSWTGSPWFCHLPVVSPLPRYSFPVRMDLRGFREGATLLDLDWASTYSNDWCMHLVGTFLIGIGGRNGKVGQQRAQQFPDQVQLLDTKFSLLPGCSPAGSGITGTHY